MLRNIDYTFIQKSQLSHELRSVNYGLFAAIKMFDKALQPSLMALWLLHAELTKAAQASKEPMVVQIRLAWWRDALIAHDFSPSLHPLLELLAPLVNAHIFSHDEWTALTMAPMVALDAPCDVHALYAPLLGMIVKLSGVDATLEEMACAALLLAWQETPSWLMHQKILLPENYLRAHGLAAEALLSGHAEAERVRAAMLGMAQEWTAQPMTHPVLYWCAKAPVQVTCVVMRHNTTLAMASPTMLDARAYFSYLKLRALRLFKV